MPSRDIRPALKPAGLAQRIPAVKSAADDDMLGVESVLDFGAVRDEAADDVAFTPAVPRSRERRALFGHLIGLDVRPKSAEPDGVLKFRGLNLIHLSGQFVPRCGLV